MPGRVIQFGSYVLPVGFAPAMDAFARDIQGAKMPRTDGARVITGYAGEKVIPIRGRLIKGPIPTITDAMMRTALDTLKSNLTGSANLYFYDDRYYRNCQAREFSASSESYLFEKVVDVEINFITGDPFQYSGNETLDTWAAPTTNTTRVITPTGNVYSAPIYKLTTGSASINWTITNQTTGKAFTIAGTSLTAGQIIEVDTLNKTVVIGATDRMDLFDGQFPELGAGANTLHNLQTLGVISSLGTLFRNRWW